MRFCRYCAVGFLSVLASLARAQTTVALTGGDAGEGMTLDAAKVVYAYDLDGASSSASFTVQGVTFTPLTVGFPFYNSTTVDPFGSGQGSANDNALRSVLQTMSWDQDGGSPLNVAFTGLTPNATYQLGLLYFSGGFASREQEFIVNGVDRGRATVSQTEAQYTYLSATANASGEINLLATASGPYGGTGHQDGAILNAVVLSNVSAVPEPATYALMTGAAVLAFAFWRRRKGA